MKVYLAADHAGFELKKELLTFIPTLTASTEQEEFEVEDCGAVEMDQNDDYPEYTAIAARALARDEASGLAASAIVIGASGQGEAMVMNRFPGVRCALYYGKAAQDQTDMGGVHLDILASTRQHNHANALSLGARFMSVEEAKEAVRSWLSTPFSSEERHVRRVEKIDAVAHG